MERILEKQILEERILEERKLGLLECQDKSKTTTIKKETFIKREEGRGEEA